MHQSPYPVTLFEHLERATDAHVAIVTPPPTPDDQAEQTEEVHPYE